jgi:hypothetical protein
MKAQILKTQIFEFCKTQGGDADLVSNTMRCPLGGQNLIQMKEIRENTVTSKVRYGRSRLLTANIALRCKSMGLCNLIIIASAPLIIPT